MAPNTAIPLLLWLYACWLLEYNTWIVSIDSENCVIIFADIFIMDTLSTESDDKQFKERTTSKTVAWFWREPRKWSEFWKILIAVSGKMQETEDDYHGDLSYEAWLAAYEVRMCVCMCVWWLRNGLLYIAHSIHLFYVSAYIDDMCY